MRRLSYFWFLVVIILGLLSPSTHALHHTTHEKFSKIHVLTSHDRVRPGESLWLMFHLELLPGWYTYWQNPGDSGLPTKIELTPPKGWTSENLLFLPPEIIQVSDITDYGYRNHAYIMLKLTAPLEGPVPSMATVPIHAHWITCFDQCVPQQAKMELQLGLGESTLALEKATIDAKLDSFLAIQDIQAHAKANDKTIEITIPISSTDSLDEPFLFLEQLNVIENTPSQIWHTNAQGLHFQLPRSFKTASNLSGYVRLDAQSHLRFEATNVSGINAGNDEPQRSSAKMTLITSIAFAFLGGLLLNVLPCVFPILTLKIVSLAKMRQVGTLHRIEHGLAYTAGIVMTFLLLAGVIAGLQAAGHQLGWGFQMQSPFFLAAMTYVLFLVGCNLMGWIEFIIPIPIQSQGPATYSIKSSFSAGLLVTIIATPCTAPFMAPAVGYALAQPLTTIITIFTVMGFGLAFPFLLLSFIPKIAFFFPKPGQWMIIFKQALAFPMFLTTAWLLWLLIKVTTPNFVASVMVGMITIGFYIWMLHSLQLSRLKKLIGLTLIAIILLAPIYATIPIKQNHSTNPPFTQEQLNATLNQYDKVLVNVTADWCITCKVNESLIFSDSKTKAFFEQNKIHIYTIDWTQSNPAITNYLHSFGRSGVPLYVYYAPNQSPKVLPQILTHDLLKKYLGE